MDHAIETCRRLIALQKRAATSGEAQAAAAALARLLERHRLTIAEVEGAGSAGGPVLVHDRPIYRCKRAETWRWELITALCEHFGVSPWREFTRMPRGDGSWRIVDSAIYLCGRVGDVECVRSMYGWLDVEGLRLALLEVPEGRATKRRTRESRRSWLIGFARGIRTQLQKAKAEEQAVPGTSSTAIVKLDQRYDEARSAILADMQDAKNGRKRNARVRGEEFVRGARMGSAIHLGQRIGAVEG